MSSKKPLTLRQMALEILKHHKDLWLSKREIAQKMPIYYPEWYANKASKYPSDKEAIAQITAEISIDISEKSGVICDLSVTPKIFQFSEKRSNVKKSNEQKDLYKESKEVLDKIDELKDLHPKLGKFLVVKQYLVAMNIPVSTGGKQIKGYNQWLHPDLVAMGEIKKQLGDNLLPNVKKCAEKMIGINVDLASFEVKKEITGSNVREVFFQTVSNSSWANHSYLVAASISDDALEQLQVLCRSHKIGLIKLDVYKPEKSIFIIECEDKEVDWNAVNRIASINTHFERYITRVLQYISSKAIDIKAWDYQ